MNDRISRREEERQRLQELVGKRPVRDKLDGTGVVLSDGIRSYCHQFDLISPFREENLKPANYKLTVGDEYAIGGELGILLDETGRDQMVIPPFEVAVIKTLETLNMPNFLIARWNIQVKLAYQGLLWVGGPQVDAGFVGHLFCPIYNLSDKQVVLRLGEPFAVIDFVKTTPFKKGDSLDYKPLPPERILLEDYNPRELRSALVTLVRKEIAGFRQQIEQLEKRVKSSETRTLTFIGILFAALAVIVTSHESTAVSFWTFLAFGVAVLALLVALGK